MEEFVGDGLYGTKLREKLEDRCTRQFRIAWEVEQMPHAGNRITIIKEDKYKDARGNYRPVIHYDMNDYERESVVAAAGVSEQWFKKLGMKKKDIFTAYKTTDAGYFTYNSTGYTVNGAGHVVGTHRMGNDSEKSVVNTKHRSWDHDNLYLVGCGNMPTLGTSNPTLTATALSIWAAHNILEDWSYL